MHVHTVRTKYTFGDRVRYSSPQNGSGSGVIVGIVFHATDPPYYYIEDASGEIAGGIFDADITPLTDDPSQPSAGVP